MKKYRKAVFIVTYRKEKNKVYYLVLKRKLHWKGWEFPKGGVESGESLPNAAKREAKEESGQPPIKIKSYSISGKYKYDRELKDRPGYFGQTFNLFSAEIKNPKVIFDKKEHSSYKWLEFDKAWSILNWPNQKNCLNIVNKDLKRNI